VKEEVKWNRTGQILHVSYIVAIAENEKLLSAANKVWYDVGCSLIYNVLGQGNIIDRVTGTIENLKAFIDYTQTAYDTYMGEFFSKNYQKTVILIWDVFVTPTQIIITATAYDIENGKPVIKPITSNTAFIINNRLVYIKQLAGGIEYQFHDSREYMTPTNILTKHNFYVRLYGNYTIGSYQHVDSSEIAINVYKLGSKYIVFHVDDLAKYHYYIWISAYLEAKGAYYGDDYIEFIGKISLHIIFDNITKANVFEQRLSLNHINYIRNGNEFILTTSKTNKIQGPRQGVLSKTIKIVQDYDYIEKYIPIGSSGYIYYEYEVIVHLWTGYSDTTNNGDFYCKMSNIHILYGVMPKMIPPQISLLKDGFQHVDGAFAVQAYSTLFRDDANDYLLGYYLLGNEPPPSYIIRDVHYDLEHSAIDYVWTIISADCYGQDIVNMKANITLDSNNETLHNYYLSIKPTVRTFDNVTLALFDLNRMAFLSTLHQIL